ncbi:hypothetical protein QUV97_07160 [Enterococcus cecorum]|uniref:hypothetical protein n=1 Tax=Enterococcus cecorum TaxID=44008 RepID=UPI0025A32B46|nr:hypothetical protein [Enterococcus cecorum]MDM8183426.1 hypothetical protein [Enterococcus cecorum]
MDRSFEELNHEQRKMMRLNKLKPLLDRWYQDLEVYRTNKANSKFEKMNDSISGYWVYTPHPIQALTSDAIPVIRNNKNNLIVRLYLINNQVLNILFSIISVGSIYIFKYSDEYRLSPTNFSILFNLFLYFSE